MAVKFSLTDWMGLARTSKRHYGVVLEPDGLLIVEMSQHRTQWVLESYSFQNGRMANAVYRSDVLFHERIEAWKHCVGHFSDATKQLVLILPTAMLLTERLTVSDLKNTDEAVEQLRFSEQQRLGEAINDAWQQHGYHVFWFAAPAVTLLGYQDLFAISDWHLSTITPDVVAVFNAWLVCVKPLYSFNLLLDVSWNSITLLFVENGCLQTYHQAAFGWNWFDETQDLSVFLMKLNIEIQTLYQFFLASQVETVDTYWYISGIDDALVLDKTIFNVQGVTYWCAVEHCHFSGSFKHSEHWQRDKHRLNRAIGAIMGSV